MLKYQFSCIIRRNVFISPHFTLFFNNVPNKIVIALQNYTFYSTLLLEVYPSIVYSPIPLSLSAHVYHQLFIRIPFFNIETRVLNIPHNTVFPICFQHLNIQTSKTNVHRYLVVKRFGNNSHFLQYGCISWHSFCSLKEIQFL